MGPLIELLTAQLEFDVSGLDLDAQLPYSDLEGRAAAPAVTARRDQLVAEARRRGLTIRQLLFHNLTGGQRMIVGTPEQVADDIVAWVDSGASDGFVINIDVQPAGFVDFIDGVVTELQDRGRFRREYAHDTLRGNLGVSGAPPRRATVTGESGGRTRDGESR